MLAAVVNVLLYVTQHIAHECLLQCVPCVRVCSGGQLFRSLVPLVPTPGANLGGGLQRGAR